MRIGYRRIALAAAIALALGCAPVHAAEVIAVDGDRAVRSEDPFVPALVPGELRPRAGVAARATPAAASASAATSPIGRRAVRRALRRALRSGVVERAPYRDWVRQYELARRTLRRLRGRRRAELGYVLASLEQLALGRRLIPSRMAAAFAGLERNRRYWRALPYPASGDRVSFRGSEVLYQYFPGRGLQLHPLTTFKKANLIHGACERAEPGCDRAALATLLDEMEAFAVQRGRHFIAWEYAFEFGGGAPPWISGMAQATGVQALARAAALLERPRYAELAREALGAFRARPPLGVRTTGPGGGTHYLQYSFAPGLFVFNAFLQSLIGLYDYSTLTGDESALRLYRAGEPEAREEVRLSDVGDWSRYSYRGSESSHDYHELLREFLQSMCNRRLGSLYCTYARRYRGYQTDPPVLTLDLPEVTRKGRLTELAFELSKLSALELEVYKGERLTLTRLATFARGRGSFLWRPRSRGHYTLRFAAKELRTGAELRDRASALVEVEPANGTDAGD